MRIKNTQSGFTLVELVISMAIGISILGLVASVYVTLTRNRSQYQTEAEVETIGNEAMNIITQAVRNAQAINSPATSTSGTTLSLAVASVADNPTVFSVSSSSIKMVLGSASYLITGSSTAASALSFTNLSASSTVGIVRVQFTLTKNSYAQTFYSSVALSLYKQ